MINISGFNSFRDAALFSAALLGSLVPVGVMAKDASVDGPDEELNEAAVAAIPGLNAPTGNSNSEFRAVFNAWRQLDTNEPMAAALSIPSRKPIDAMSLSSAYGMRVHPVTGRLARHNGIDVPAPHGTAIYATADGVIGRAQRLGGYGNYVEIEHGSAIQTRYGHMSSYVVTSGQRVKRGDIIGYVGSTGRSTGNHLHYEVRIAGAPVNPLPFVQSTDFIVAMKDQSGQKVAMGGPE